MKIQSLSIVVPNKRCVNDCEFCVAKMSCNNYVNQMDDNLPFFDLYLEDYLKALKFARHNGCNTAMLTGNSEPQQNRKFLTYFGMFMRMMQDPFEWIELQTTGVMLDRNYLRFLRNHVGVKTISLSLSSLDSDRNAAFVNMPAHQKVDIEKLCAEIREYDFTLRLSLNLTNAFLEYHSNPQDLFAACKRLGANQVTLRTLYADGNETKQANWVSNFTMRPDQTKVFDDFVVNNGKPLGRLPYGYRKFGITGMCIVSDADSMSKDESKQDKENYKYLILQPDCKLYSQWDDPASLIF